MDNELAGVGRCDRKAGGQGNQWMPPAVAMKLDCFRPGLILLGAALLSVVLVMLSNTRCSMGSSQAPHGMFRTHEELPLGQQLSQGLKGDSACRVQAATNSGQLAVLNHPKIADLATKPYIELLPGLEPSSPPPGQPEMRIPRIIHQHYNRGIDAFRQMSGKAGSPFKKEWCESCKAQHPGWTYILWDEDSCEALIKQHYPQFLDTWNLLRHREGGSHPIVRTGDFVRPVFLHALGGVHLDTDVECYIDMTPWLQGTDLVLQEQDPGLILNGQMASAPGNALWLRALDVLRNVTAQTVKASKLVEPLEGLRAVNTAFENFSNKSNGARLSGWHDLTARQAGHAVVYDFHQWLYLCRWNEGTTCEVAEAAKPPSQNRMAAVAAVPMVIASKSDKKKGLEGVYALAGAQHYSGSWGGGVKEGSTEARLKAESAVMSFFGSGINFTEHRCETLSILGASLPLPDGTLAQRRQIPVPVCWEDVAAAAATDEGCTTVLVHPSYTHGIGLGRRSLMQDYPPLEAAMAAVGCKVVIVAPVKMQKAASFAGPAIQSVYALLGTSGDPTADPPVVSLSSLLCSKLWSRVTVLLLPAHIAEPRQGTLPDTPNKTVTVTAAAIAADTRQGTQRTAEIPGVSVLDLLAGLYANSSEVLSRVDQVIVSKPARPSNGSTTYAAYQHLYSQQGFLGYWWSEHVMAFTRPARRW